jgi:dihydrofolate reductase
MNVFLIAAISADGFVGKTGNHRSSDWTSPEDLRFYVDRIKEADAIIVGSRTFQTFHRYPKGSNWIIYTRTPETFENPNPKVITAMATNEEPKDLIKRLAAEGKQNIAISGGASVYTMFMNAGVVNKLYLTIEPVLFGSGIKLFDKDVSLALQLVNTIRLTDQTVVLEYNVQ